MDWYAQTGQNELRIRQQEENLGRSMILRSAVMPIRGLKTDRLPDFGQKQRDSVRSRNNSR
jgi:hypothetical protein